MNKGSKIHRVRYFLQKSRNVVEKTGRFYTFMASFTRMRRHPLDLFGVKVFELDNPLLRLVSLIHDFFLESHLTASAPEEANFRHLSSFYVLPHSLGRVAFSASGETFRIALVCGRGNASTSLNVRFYYDVTMNYCRGKFVKFAKNTSIDDI